MKQSFEYYEEFREYPKGRPEKIKHKVPMSNQVIGEDNGIYMFVATSKGLDWLYIGSIDLNYEEI